MKLYRQGVKSKTDETLMRLVIKKDQGAYEELLNRYMLAIFRFSYSLLHDEGKAEDITQETFVTLWNRPDMWQPNGQLKSWLFRIARNKSIDEIRSRKTSVDINDVSLPDTMQSSHVNAFNAQVTDMVNAGIKQLPQRQSEAIMLVHFLEHTNIEAAEVMEISVDALESLLARGRKKLRELLGSKKENLFREDYDE